MVILNIVIFVIIDAYVISAIHFLSCRELKMGISTGCYQVRKIDNLAVD